MEAEIMLDRKLDDHTESIKNIGETVNSVYSKQKTFNRMMEETNEKLAGVVKDRIPVSDTDKKALPLAQQK